MSNNEEKDIDLLLDAQYKDELETFDAYLADLGYSEQTISSYFSDIRLLLRHLYIKKSYAVDLNTVKRRDIVEFLRQHHRNAAKSTRNRRLMSIRSFYRGLVKSEILTNNPTEDIDVAKQEKNAIPVYLSDEELSLFFKLIPNGKYYVRNKAILMLMGLAGLRVIEVHSLNITDLTRDPINPGVEISGKGNKTRYIPLPLPLYSLLLEYEQMHRGVSKEGHTNAFFVSRNGNRLSKRRIQEVTEETFANVKSNNPDSYLIQKKITSHKLRHTFGTNKIREGVDVVTLQELLGHENLNTTQIYTHVNNKQKENAMRNTDVSHFFD